MITAGIDAGSKAIKVVILKDGEVAASSVGGYPMESDTNEAASLVLESALQKAGLSRADVDSIIATGTGRKDVLFAKTNLTDVTSAARGIYSVLPQAKAVIDLGAEQCRVVKCDGKGGLVTFAMNDRCAAGVGMFLETMAKALEVPIEEVGDIALQSQSDIEMNTTCAVFAESEVVSLISRGEKKQDILRAVHKAVAARTAALLSRVSTGEEVALIGGVARNRGVVHFLREELGEALVVAEEPEIVAARGAAILAQNDRGGEIQ
jgi:predicted CoA-substrate-specific enzyme activase